MRTLILFPALLIATACSASADQGDHAASGVKGTRSFALSGFDAVELAGPDNVVVKTGKAISISATGDQSVLDQLEIEVRGGTLHVGRKKSNGIGFSWGGRSRGSATVTVTLPEITGASVAGSGDMSVDTVATRGFGGGIAGSGTLSIASIKADKVKLSVAGSGDARVGGGSAGALAISIAGSGNVDAGALAATSADISIAGSGNARAGVSGDADVSILGSGDVDIIGGAKCSISKMGSGDVRCGAK